MDDFLKGLVLDIFILFVLFYKMVFNNLDFYADILDPDKLYITAYI